MPLVHDSPIFSVDEAALYLMLTDTAGAAPTYGPKIPVPGINGTTVNPEQLAKELFGDGKVQGRASVLRQIMVGLTYSRLALNVLSTITGGTTVDAGTTPAQTATFGIGKSASPPYVKVEFRIITNLEIPGPSGGGSVTVKLNKSKLIDWGPGITKEDYGMQTANFGCVHLQGTANIIDIVFNETAAALSA